MCCQISTCSWYEALPSPQGLYRVSACGTHVLSQSAFFCDHWIVVHPVAAIRAFEFHWTLVVYLGYFDSSKVFSDHAPRLTCCLPCWLPGRLNSLQWNSMIWFGTSKQGASNSSRASFSRVKQTLPSPFRCCRRRKSKVRSETRFLRSRSQYSLGVTVCWCLRQTAIKACVRDHTMAVSEIGDLDVQTQTTTAGITAAATPQVPVRPANTYASFPQLGKVAASLRNQAYFDVSVLIAFTLHLCLKLSSAFPVWHAIPCRCMYRQAQTVEGTCWKQMRQERPPSSLPQPPATQPLLSLRSRGVMYRLLMHMMLPFLQLCPSIAQRHQFPTTDCLRQQLSYLL